MNTPNSPDFDRARQSWLLVMERLVAPLFGIFGEALHADVMRFVPYAEVVDAIAQANDVDHKSMLIQNLTNIRDSDVCKQFSDARRARGYPALDDMIDNVVRIADKLPAGLAFIPTFQGMLFAFRIGVEVGFLEAGEDRIKASKLDYMARASKTAKQQATIRSLEVPMLRAKEAYNRTYTGERGSKSRALDAAIKEAASAGAKIQRQQMENWLKAGFDPVVFVTKSRKGSAE